MPTWKKSSEELIEAFHAALPDDPRVERRKMFGYPAAFVGGNMFAGLHEERVVVRLGEKEREKLRAIEGAKIFEPMKGRPMTAYTVVPPTMHRKAGELRKWLVRALEFGATLPAKTAKKKAAPAKSRAPKKR